MELHNHDLTVQSGRFTHACVNLPVILITKGGILDHKAFEHENRHTPEGDGSNP